MVVEDSDLPKKSLGQHWLSDPMVLDSIAKMADISQVDVILEVGPGPGSLTDVLLQRAAKVIAVEFDPELASKLAKRLKYETKLEVYNEDIRRFDLTKLPKDYKVVANIPYYLTSYLVRLLSVTKNPPQCAVLLIQQEVAERLAAEPGQLSLLGVLAQSFWEVELGPIVLPEMFFPPPKVNSQVVKLTRRPLFLYNSATEKAFLQTVRIGFSQKRKTLVNGLSGGFHIPKLEARAIIESVGLAESVRPQELSVSDWIKLTTALNSAKK